MTLLEKHLSSLYRLDEVKLSKLLEALDEELQTRDEVFTELKKILSHLDWKLQG